MQNKAIYVVLGVRTWKARRKCWGYGWHRRKAPSSGCRCNGRPCHSFTSSSTASVALEISVGEELYPIVYLDALMVKVRDDAVHLLQVALDLARRHPPRTHRDDLVVEAGPARLPLGHYLGVERGFVVARRFQFQLAEVALQRFWAFPVARVPPVVARPIVLRVAQMIGHLGLQGL